MIKIIFSDMDGTLLDEHGNVPAGFDETIAELEKRGVMFAPASGRQYYSLEDSFMKYKDRFLFLAENGTVVMYKGEKIFTCPMNKQLAQQVLKAAEPLENVYSVFCGTKNGYVLKHQYTEEFLASSTSTTRTRRPSRRSSMFPMNRSRCRSSTRRAMPRRRSTRRCASSSTACRSCWPATTGSTS